MNSGADGNFVDQNFITQTDIPTEPLAEAKEVSAIDCNILVQVIHVTVPVSLTLSGNHCETFQFVISLPPSLLVLGLPWLGQHNPNIDWSSASIQNWSHYCHAHCLRSAFSVEPSASPDPPEEIELDNVPQTASWGCSANKEII